ncbi:bifunctional pyr operon transcriptional regulator/uracil phosphoribosyltransferase PyrR [bacterium]|nr:bifunctional pyr operon transcriptional regulator/uracil phosphoribosyltransferase PyrR [bacterium]
MAAPKKSATKKPKAAPSKVAKKAAAEGPTVLMDCDQVADAIHLLAERIHAEFPSPRGLVVLGIRTRGVILAERIRARLEELYGESVASGVIDITFYRDDLSRHGPNPMVRGSEIPFDITDATIVLVDDVLYTGRTIRAAMDEITDFGRPALVRLATLVDRGLREYPIQPDYVSLSIKTTPSQVVHVLLDEVDDRDEVVLDTRKR